VSAAASLATLKVILENDLRDQVEKKSNLFKSLLVHEKIKSIRNKGLMMDLEMEDFETLKAVIDRAIELGVVTDWSLYCDNSMRIAPPLTISEVEIHEACSIILQAIQEAC